MDETAQLAQDLAGDEGRSDEAIKVSVRVRPMNSRERERGSGGHADDLWTCEENTFSMMQDGKVVPSASFSFDHLFPPGTTNEQLYEKVAREHPASVVKGYDSVIFAYGMTSSGKTHTMMGTELDAGVTPRAVHDLFKAVAATEQRNFFIRVSYIEIYNEVIRDLLAPGNDNLKVHEDWSGKVFVEAVEQIVGSAEHVLQIMKQGEENRTFGATQMNERSSRSHTIFSLRVQSTAMSSEEEVKEEGRAVRQSSLSLVDLAGSERASSTGAEGVRLKEGGHINKSLLVLGNVINKLSEGNLSHVPYRDSKLTRVLQSALGGNAKTSIICAITPAPIHVEETLSTLKFASRAKKVTNTTQCNEILDDRALIRRQQKEILKLRAMLGGSVPTLEPGPSLEFNPGLGNNVELEEKIAKLEKLLKASQNIDQPDPKTKRPKRRLTTNSVETGNMRVDNSGQLLDLQQIIQRKEAEILQYCKVASKAEQERDQVKNRAGYEVEVLRNEVERLAIAAASSEHRATLARQDADHALRDHSRATVLGVWDSMISVSIGFAEKANAISSRDSLTSEKRDLEEIRDRMTGEIKQMKKELADAARREKMGVGPVLKEANALRNKLAELESKWKTAKQNSARLETEKSSLLRESKDLQRQLRIQSSEVSKVREATARAKEASVMAANAERRSDELESRDAKNLETIERLKTETTQLTEELEASRKSTKTLMTETKDLKLTIEAVEKRLLQVTADGESSKSGLNEALERLRQTEQKLIQSRESETEQTTRIEKVLKEKLELEESVALTSKDLESANTRVQQLRSLVDESTKASQDLERQLDLSRREVNASVKDVARLEDTVDTLTANNRESMKESSERLMTAESRGDALQKKLAEQVTEVSTVQEENKKLSAKLVAVESALEQADAGVVEVMARNKLLEQEVASLEKSSGDLQEKDSCTPNERVLVAKLEEELAVAKENSASCRGEIKDCLERLACRDNLIMELRQQQQSSDDDARVHRYREKVERRDKQIRSLKSQLSFLEGEAVVRGEEDAFLMRTKIGALQADLEARNQALERCEMVVKDRETLYNKILRETTRLRQVLKQKDVERLELESRMNCRSPSLADKENCVSTETRSPCKKMSSSVRMDR